MNTSAGGGAQSGGAATVSSGRSMCTVVPDDLAGVVLLRDTDGGRNS